MNITRIGQPSEIYENSALVQLMMTCMHAPTEGKVRSIAQTTYSKNQGFFYVYEEDGTVLGLIGGSEVDGKVFTLKHLAVKNSMQGKGIATALIKHLIASRRFDTLKAEASSDNVGFFKKLGLSCKESSDPLTDSIFYACVWKR